MKRGALRRRPHKDPVTPQVRQTVFLRDQEQANIRTKTANPCVAAFLLPSTSGPCWGPLTLDHVKDRPMMGKRAPSDEQHLVTLCAGHHLETDWATSHRPLLRWYLASIYDTEP